MLPTDHGGTRWSSLGRLYGATPTPKGMDPNGRLYQTGVGTIHPQPQTNALDQYANGCSNSVVAGFVRDIENKQGITKKLHVDRVFKIVKLLTRCHSECNFCETDTDAVAFSAAAAPDMLTL